ncbi:MAG: hypothetical protein GVY04_19430 [Cyanobacteria bacterium]|nr:hypothetical protein [Cyanobacteria bacterium GSL.Bin1]
MKTSLIWLNFLSLLPATLLSLLTIAVAFLRFYDEQDFTILGQITEPRLWSNRLTVAALLVAMVNFGIEWNRRNRETDRLAQAGEREAQERERAARRARIQNRWAVLQIRHQLEASESNRRALTDFLVFLQEYGE